MKFKKLFLGLVSIILLVTLVYFFVNKTEETDQVSAGTEAPEFTVPSGWFLHRVGETSILTRQAELPDTSAAEGFALGEQISFQRVRMDRATGDWIIARVPPDDPIFSRKDPGSLNGFQTLIVEHEAPASGKVMDYYLFSGDEAYIFSLYPLELNEASSTERNTEGVKTLERVVKDFASKLKSE